MNVLASNQKLKVKYTPEMRRDLEDMFNIIRPEHYMIQAWMKLLCKIDIPIKEIKHIKDRLEYGRYYKNI